MFSKSDGPTALRADLVRALSFSMDRVERRSAGATVASLAALAAVWNGRKGHVALIVRDVEPAAIERYVGSGPILSESDLDAVIDEGLAFAESLGFAMDAPEFAVLSPEDRDARIYRWNKLRKIRARERADAAEESSPSMPALDALEAEPDPEPEPGHVPAGYEIELEDLAVPPPPSEFSAELIARAGAADPRRDAASRAQSPPSAVLGKISLVKKRGADVRRLELLARLLAYY